jgi:biopolymer transport protein ExbB/TolQ
MKVLEYLKPENVIAKWVVYVLAALFVFWLGSLVWSLWRHLHYREEIKNCQDVRKLRDHLSAQNIDAGEAPLFVSPRSGERIFQSFQAERRLWKRSPIARHLHAIFDAGWSEGPLDARALMKNTADELFRLNSLHKSLLSIFIVLGLLGTLFGLADTMSSLDALLRETSQLNNTTLSQSLQRLLGTLKSAFAPSIWGVSLTVLGVLLFAVYMRVVALPLGGLLERMTLTVWIPQLMPTASQKLQERLRVSREQMERAVAASQEVTDFAEDIRSKTGSLRETLGLTTEAFKRMAEVADRLGIFSQQFAHGVSGLTNFQEDLRALYQQMVDESRAFQAGIQHNIAGSEEFQKQIQAQLISQHEQTAQLLQALRSYEKAYVESRGRIDEGLTGVLEKAQHAYESLSKRNEEIGLALDDAIGKPLREDLARDLNAIQIVLSQMGETQQVQLNTLSQRMSQLDQPLNAAARNFSETFSNFDESTRDWLTKLQREFERQNDTNQKQLDRLETLSQQIPQLLALLTTSSDKFSETSGSFATRGEELAQNTKALSEHIATLGHGVNALSEQVKRQPSADGDHAAAVINEQTELLRRVREEQTSRNKR